MIATATKRNMHAYMAPDGTIDRTTVLCGFCFEHTPYRVEVYKRLKEAGDNARPEMEGYLTNPEGLVFNITGWAETRDNPPRCIKCQYSAGDSGLTVSGLASILGATPEHSWVFEDEHKDRVALAQITNNDRRVVYEIIGLDTETWENEAVLLNLKYCEGLSDVEPQPTLGDPINYPVYGDPDYMRAMPGMYAFLPWDNKPYSGRLVWIAPDDETIDEATEVGDIEGISPEDARNLISILNEGLKLLVERDNQPFDSGPVENRRRVYWCRACTREIVTSHTDRAIVCIPCTSAGKYWSFTPIHSVNPNAGRPFGVQLHDLRKPAQKAVWNIWTFTLEEQKALLAQFSKDPLGVVDALRHIELQDDDGEPSLFE